MPQASEADIQAAWAPIQEVINKTWQIMVVGDATQVFTTQDWMNVYTAIVDWHVKGPAKPKDPNNPATGCDEADKAKFRDLMSGLIKQLIRTEKEKIEKLNGVPLLSTYLNTFVNFVLAMSRIAKLAAYPEKYHLQHEPKKYIIHVCNMVWEEELWNPLMKRLLDELFKLIDDGREGAIWDKTLLGKMRDMLLKLGESHAVSTAPPATSAMTSTRKIAFYHTQLLEPFVARTVEFYTKESAAFLASNSVVDYLRLVDRRLEEEQTLATAQLQSTSVDKVVKECEKVLISSVLETLKAEFKKMLQSEREDDMRFFFRILRRVQDGLKESALTLGEKLESEGRAHIAGQSSKMNDRSSLQASPDFVQQMITLYHKYCGIVKRCFEDELIFQQAMDGAFKKLINSEVGIFSMPEIFNYFIDKQLKDKKLDEAAADASFDSIVALMVYLTDKDILERSLNRALSKRLLAGKSNETRESSFIAKLKQRCGDSITRNMEDMINDIHISDETATQFSAWLKEKYPNVKASAAVKVLKSNRWAGLSKIDMQPTAEWIPIISGFAAWYGEAYPTRGLTWNYGQGQCTVVMNFTEKGRSKSCQLSLSMVQASILLLFNDSPTLSFEDIQQRLSITNSDQLAASMAPLVYFKAFPLLVRKPLAHDAGDEEETANAEGGDAAAEKAAEKAAAAKAKAAKAKDEEVILKTDTFQLRVIDKAPAKPSIAYPAATAAAARREATDDRTRVVEERNTRMDLVIVRIMKSRNIVPHNELMEEVGKQLAHLFIVERRPFTQRIDSLIERGYMLRDENDRTKYHYVA